MLFTPWLLGSDCCIREKEPPDWEQQQRLSLSLRAPVSLSPFLPDYDDYDDVTAVADPSTVVYAAITRHSVSPPPRLR